MNPIRRALRMTALIGLAVVGFALVLFSPDTSHVKIGNVSLDGGVARADAPACSSCGGDSDAAGACAACADSDGDCS